MLGRVPEEKGWDDQGSMALGGVGDLREQQS